MSLYQKVRPTEFEDLVGNKETVASIEATIKKPDRPHVYLLAGGSGCGKTTVARICAAKLGAKDMSVVEINSSNNRGIETARQITEEMRYPSFDGPKVYIIDECHSATKDWQNAMLKPLEDTPDHVYFFLCTTDPQKLIKPLMTRCTDFMFNALDIDEMEFLLRKTNRAEQLNVSKEVITEIAENAGGSPRKGLTILEKVAAVEDTNAQLAVAREGYSEADEKETIDLCRALLSEKTSWGQIATLLKSIKGDPEQVRHAVMGYMSAVLLSGKKNNKAATTIEYFSEPFYNTNKPGLVLACYQSLFLSE